MADVTPSKVDASHNCVVWTWAHLTQLNPQGVALGANFVDFVDRSVQIEGNFDGASIVLEGSNDGANYHTLTDPQGSPISKLSAAIVQTTEMAVSVRPRVVGATGNTDLTVTLGARKSQYR